MVPRGKKKYVGIEVEFNSRLDEYDCELLLKDYDIDSFCEVTTDSSIDGLGVELRILTSEDTLKKKLTKVQKFLDHVSIGADESCGLHVHIDMRNRNPLKAFTNLLHKQKELWDMVPKRRLDSDFCEPVNPGEFFLTPEEIFKREYERCNRYRDINVQALKKFNTIEIRNHEGTVDTKEIFNWCNYLIKVVDAKEQDKRYVKKRITYIRKEDAMRN